MSAGADMLACARPIDAQPLHQGLQRGAFQAESRGGARGTAHHPLGLVVRNYCLPARESALLCQSRGVSHR